MLSLWQTQLRDGDASHFPFLTTVHATKYDDGLNQYSVKITDLLQKLERRFQVFRQLQNKFTFHTSPFTVNANDLSADIQLVLIDLKCDSILEQKFVSVCLDTFHQYLLQRYPRLITQAGMVLSMFGTTYLCEQTLTVMNFYKT